MRRTTAIQRPFCLINQLSTLTGFQYPRDNEHIARECDKNTGTSQPVDILNGTHDGTARGGVACLSPLLWLLVLFHFNE